MIKNIFFNFLGFIWSVASNFLFLPFYIKILGFQSYSIIAYPLIIVGVASILDTVFTSTLSRELSRKDTFIDHKIKIFDSIENIYIYSIICVSIILYISIPFLVINFIKSSSFSSSEISLFFRYFLFDFSFSLIIRFYFGAILGLKKQVIANKLLVFWGFMKNGIVIFVIYFFPSLLFFYSWQAIISFVFLIAFRIILNRELYGVNFVNKLSWGLNFDILRPLFKFSLGIFFIAFVSIVSTMLDRIYISRFFDAEVLGNYTLAISICTVVYIMTKPISVAILPVFTEFVTTENHVELNKLFSLILRAVIAITFSVSLSVFFYAEDILFFWLHDIALAKSSGIFLKILVVGYSISSLQHLYYDVVIANGITKINNYIGIATLLAVFPSYYFGAQFLGTIGIPLSFTVIQIVATFVYIFYVNNKYIKENGFLSLFFNIYLFPFLWSFLFILFFHSFISLFHFSNIITIIAFFASVFLATVLNIFLLNINKSIFPLIQLIIQKF
jgi:O-antigen/teichoic acid export membrane protein